jgi:CheY-like chemotaxis protein
VTEKLCLAARAGLLSSRKFPTQDTARTAFMSDLSPSPAPSGDVPPPGTIQKRILVIDDDDMVRTFVRRALEGEGYAIAMAANGYEAMVQFRQFKPDGVITDLLMPERDGIETILEIRKLEPQIPIIAITGGMTAMGSVYLKTAERLGADAVLSKPFTIVQLLTTVEMLMNPKPGSPPT